MGSSGRAYAAVASGGVLGAGARAILMQRWPSDFGDFPWSLLLVNTVGCAVLGALLAWGARRVSADSWESLWRPFLATGVLGGFTTTSAYAVAAVELNHSSASSLSFGFVVISVLAGLGAFAGSQALALRVVAASR